jgi:hypothetical protein
MVGFWFSYLNGNGKGLFSTSMGELGKKPVEVALMGGPDLFVVGRGWVSKLDFEVFVRLLSLGEFPINESVLFYRQGERWERFDTKPTTRLREELCASVN